MSVCVVAISEWHPARATTAGKFTAGVKPDVNVPLKNVYIYTGVKSDVNAPLGCSHMELIVKINIYT